MIRLGFLLAAVRRQHKILRTDTVGAVQQCLPARVGARGRHAEKFPAKLRHHAFTHTFRAVLGHRVRNFVADNCGQPGLVLRDRQNAGINADLAAGQAERVRLLALEHDEFPLRVRHVLAGDGGDTVAYLLHQRVRGGVLADGCGFFQRFKAGKAKRHLLVGGNEINLRTAGDGNRVTASD